ncbi:MAG: oligosaccharide flippase family protein [Prevotellaceae bacterium]|jgi:PST family polysaccharide transporter|nr:oligosaccharide flippase family protein [Prevotellaceae bacterium]
MNGIKTSLKRLFQSKVAENYFFMTFLQGANLLIGLLLYPYLIRVLGKEAYGTYIFIFSNIQFFFIFVAFGFDYPALKKISLFPTDKKIKSRTVSEVFTAKVCLLALCAVVLSLLIYSIPFVRANAAFYIIIFATLLIDILFPSWYFQGIQKMKFVTYVNLTLRILTIPLIFIFIKSPTDLLKYTLIVSLLPVWGGVFTFFYLQIKEKIQIRFVSFKKLRPLFADALPFFWTSAFSTAKRETVTLIVGTFFNMESVALYDLANKIVNIPRLITNSINSALFPKVLQNYNSENVKKIIRYEKFIGLGITVLVAALGYWAVLILGGKTMLAAYPLAVILSFTIYAWLIVGCYIDFLFVPQNKYYFVTKNQFAALVSFLIFAGMALLISKNIVLLISAYVLSHVVEIIYCRYLIKKHRLL